MYLVGDRVGQGGFGVVYRAEQASGDPLDSKELCLKVCGDVSSWHCEAYFGQLLHRKSRVVKVFDSFASIPRTKGAKPRYCLITEFAEHGDLVQYSKGHAAAGLSPWRPSSYQTASLAGLPTKAQRLGSMPIRSLTAF